VQIFFNKLTEKGYDTRSLAHMKICAVGSSTVSSLNEKGIKPDFVPKRAVGEAIFECLSQELTKEDCVLMPKSAIARDYLVESLGNLCKVKAIDLYNTVTEMVDKDMILGMLDKGEIDYITFTSSSTVTNFLNGIGIENKDRLRNTKLVSMGPITSKTIREYGLQVYKEPENYTIDGLVECIVSNKE